MIHHRMYLEPFGFRDLDWRNFNDEKNKPEDAYSKKLSERGHSEPTAEKRRQLRKKRR